MKKIDILCWEEEITGNVGEVPPRLGDLALDLSFARPRSVDFDLRQDLKVFAIRFHSPLVGAERPYAPLFAHVIKRLMGDEFTLCLSVSGEIRSTQQIGDKRTSEWRIPLANWLVDHELMPRKLWYSMLVLPGPLLLGAQSFFFECPQPLVGTILNTYWKAFQSMDLEGYVLPAASVSMLETWNRRSRDAELFSEVMSSVFVALRAFGDNDGILVVTRKLSFEEFKERIALETLFEIASQAMSPTG